jgi:hypothetical protein
LVNDILLKKRKLQPAHRKLDGFIRKFYINQLLRGALVHGWRGAWACSSCSMWRSTISTSARAFERPCSGVLSGPERRGAVPMGRAAADALFPPGKVISHEQAAQIIGQHFTDVKDKLLNILQLKQQSNNAIYAELINASINQKSNEIKLVPFQAAIDLGKNRKYLRYALPPVMLLLFLLLGAPNILREGTKRLWNSTTKFEKPAPFKFLINPDSLKAVQFSDYVLKVKVEAQRPAQRGVYQPRQRTIPPHQRRRQRSFPTNSSTSRKIQSSTCFPEALKAAITRWKCCGSRISCRSAPN